MGNISAETMQWIMMIGVGALAGTLAARIMKGDSFGLIINALLGIAGAIVGGALFNFLGWDSPGGGIVDAVKENFDVPLPPKFVGSVISATIGAILILWVSRILGLGKGRA